MEKFNGVSVHIRNFKSFGIEGGGFTSIRRINIVIGRNNSGKSALLDLIERCCRGGQLQPKHHHRGTASELLIHQRISDETASRVFVLGTSGGPIPGSHWHVAGQHVVGAVFSSVLENGEPKYHSGLHEREGFWSRPDMREYYQRVANAEGNPFSGLAFRRVAAERDVSREQAVAKPSISENGEGLTSTIAFFLNRAEQPSSLIEQNLLDALNRIMFPDARYSNIIVQIVDDLWEIFLVEHDGHRVALSDCGSGLKTILQVLANLILVPTFEKKEASKYIFAFEELENNLHPALQRRLFSFIEEWLEKNGGVVFATTHSNVIIDMFARSENAALTHVVKKNGRSEARGVETYADGRAILDDLDVRASDLLQSNGVVWLEGPSDRVYFNRWVELASGGRLREGTHYQCLYYAGRLLAHLSGDAPDAAPDELVATLSINRNGLILMDSDRKSSDARKAEGKPNDTKVRIEQEFEKMGGVAHITSAREVENYIPHSTLKRVFGDQFRNLSKFDDIGDHLESEIGAGEKKKFERGKVAFAQKISDHMLVNDLADVPELKAFVDRAVAAISSWNQLS